MTFGITFYQSNLSTVKKEAYVLLTEGEETMQEKDKKNKKTILSGWETLGDDETGTSKI